MKTIDFSISQEQLVQLQLEYPNLGKNSHVGLFAVEIAKIYFTSINPDTIFITNKFGIDLSTTINGIVENYEIKGTTDKNIAWNKLKVSSQQCYDHLIHGMTLIRITNIGQVQVNLHFLKHKVDFELIPEPRWSVRKKSPLI